MVYFTNEQGIGLSTYERRPDGQLVLRQDLAALPEGISKQGLTASDLEITPDGKFIFAGLRGHTQDFDRITRYRVREDGRAEVLGLTPADKIPWGLALSPDGRYLLVSAYNGATLTGYRITNEGDLVKAGSLTWDAEISDLLTLATAPTQSPDLSKVTPRTDLEAVIAATSEANMKQELAGNAPAIVAAADLTALSGAPQLEALTIGLDDLPEERLAQLGAFAHAKSLWLVSTKKKPFSPETQAKVKALLPTTKVEFQ
jgi:hypothetical protein